MQNNKEPTETIDALMSCVISSDLKRLEELLAGGTDPDLRSRHGSTALMEACWRGDIDSARLLIQYGADVNAAANGGTSAIMLAAWKDYLDIVGLLIALGADVNAAENEPKKTALQYTADNIPPRCASILVEAGASPEPIRNSHPDLYEQLSRIAQAIKLKDSFRKNNTEQSAPAIGM